MSSYSVIVVEDDSDHRELIESALDASGLTVKVAGTTIEFFQNLVHDSFDIIILDIGLPDHSGFSILQYLQEKKLNTSMGVIVLTAHDSAEDRVRGYELGADLYLVKPIDVRELSFAVKNLISRMGNNTEKLLSSKLDAWQLNTENWQLTAPNGECCNLSAKEMELIQKLHQLDGEVLNKYLLGAAMGYSDDEHGKRALESAILRLRRKLANMGCTNTPIKTAHGVGYTFSAKLIVS